MIAPAPVLRRRSGSTRAPMALLERHRERGVEGQRAEREADDARGRLPPAAARQLVERGDQEPQCRRREHGGRHELAGRRRRRHEHGRGREDQQQAERVAGRAGRPGERHEPDREPGAREDRHAGAGHDVAGQEAEDRRHELERNDERDDDHPERVALGGLDPAELQAAQQQRSPGERQESERQGIRDRPQRDAREGFGRGSRSPASGTAFTTPPPAPAGRLPSCGCAPT